MTRFKICCIQNKAEAVLAVNAGAAALGLVSEMPSGPGVINEKDIREIAAHVPEGVDTFLLTSKQNAMDIIKQHSYCKTTALQLVDHVPFNELASLRSELPGVKLVQVIHVQDERSLNEVADVEIFVDVILLDSGNPNAATKELGGTGRTHNWDISAEIVSQTNLPVYLAGGLNPDNVAEAVSRVKPFAVDICSGLRVNGLLDSAKLSRFVDAL